MPAKKKPDDRQFQVGEKVRVNLHHGKINEAVVRVVIPHDNEVKLQVDVVVLDLTTLIDTGQGCRGMNYLPCAGRIAPVASTSYIVLHPV